MTSAKYLTGPTIVGATNARLPSVRPAVAGQRVFPATGWRAGLDTPPQPHILYDKSKRAIDTATALILLILSLPVLLLACAAILLSTGRSPILVQTRVGRGGREFAMLKLRTMSEGAEAEHELPLATSGVGVWGRGRPQPPGDPDEVFVPKTPCDARVTAIGRVLRRTSIDELPQLLNVLAGQMSLVGPRPALPEEVARYPNSWHRRLTVKPGLTGLWQVSGRSTVPPRRRTAMDRVYIRRRSLWFDCLLLLRTIAATASMRGAW